MLDDLYLYILQQIFLFLSSNRTRLLVNQTETCAYLRRHRLNETEQLRKLLLCFFAVFCAPGYNEVKTSKVV